MSKDSDLAALPRDSDQTMVPLATAVHLYTNAVWIENDILGDHHVMVQSEAPGSTPHSYCTFHYDHRYTSNSSLDQAAESVALSIGATAPVERRFREIAGASTPGSKAVRILSAPETRVENGPVQFGDDWPGVFIRGDSAGYYAMTLRTLLEPVPDAPASTDVFVRIQLRGLYDLLRASVVGPAGGMLQPVD